LNSFSISQGNDENIDENVDEYDDEYDDKLWKSNDIRCYWIKVHLI
jgi:hypothetical protein